MNYFGLCPVVVSLIEGFFHVISTSLYTVSLCVCVCVCVCVCGLLFNRYLIIIEHKLDACYILMRLYLNKNPLGC